MDGGSIIFFHTLEGGVSQSVEFSTLFLTFPSILKTRPNKAPQESQVTTNKAQ